MWSILRKAGNYPETKTLAKFIYRLLKSPYVPNHLWIKGHISCAKTLLHNPTKPCYDDAINLLKNLCQILPPLPLPESIYSIQKNLKVNEPLRPRDVVPDSLFGGIPFNLPTDNQMKPTAVKVVNMEMQGTIPSRPMVSGISIIDDESAKYVKDLKKQRTQQFEEESEFTFEKELAQLEDLKPGQTPSILEPGMRKCSIFYQQMALQQECNKTGKIVPLMPSFRSSRPSIACAVGAVKRESIPEKEMHYQEELFSVSTQWDYLYLLGKIAIKYDVNYKFGVHVMSDLIGLLSLFCGESSYTANKAKYYIGIALIKAEHFEDAKALLSSILPSAQKDKLRDNIKKQYDICCSKLKGK